MEDEKKMEDEKEAEETPNRGNDWEVVSLTASAYAAAPGPEVFDSGDDSHVTESSRDEEVNRAMFMSGHFVFPPSQHENLPLEPIETEIHVEPGTEVVGSDVSGLDMEEGDRSEKTNEESQPLKGIKEPEEMPGIQFFDEKGNLSGLETEFEEGKALKGLNLVEDEHTIFNAHKFSSLLGEADVSETTMRDEDIIIPKPNVSTESNLDPSSDSSKSMSPTKANKNKRSGLPCEAWWRRQAASFYAQAKEANAFWSVFVAAALMGLVILGQRWQQERWQTLQSNVNDEKVGRMMGSLSRFKDVLVGGGQRHTSILRGSASSTER